MRAAFLEEFFSYRVMEKLYPARAMISPQGQESKREDEFSWNFAGKPGVESMQAFPPLLCFLQLFLFSPVGYYFVTHFDNYFINQER